ITPTPLSASVADSVTVTSAEYAALEQAEPSQAIDEVGAVVSTWTSCDFVASTLPTLSHARNFTVVVEETLKGAVYSGLEAVGSLPSVVYRITATPLSASTAESATLTGAAYQPAEHVAWLHAID